jgi:hypothetical protein
MLAAATVSAEAMSTPVARQGPMVPGATHRPMPVVHKTSADRRTLARASTSL